jgi:hypothetical protein
LFVIDAFEAFVLPSALALLAVLAGDLVEVLDVIIKMLLVIQLG